MKATKIIYWTTTVLFAGFMIMSGIPNILLEPETVKFLTNLGYPEYIIPFLGVAKVAGSIAILIPSLYKVKEWAYAGLFFDLIGAAYSVIAKEGFDPSMMVMVLIFAVAITSYLYNAKLFANGKG